MIPTPRVAPTDMVRPRGYPTEMAQTPRVAPTDMADGQHGSAMLKLKRF
jgi:hypothetical protein